MCIFCDNFGMHMHIDAYNHPETCQSFKEYLIEQQYARSREDADVLSLQPHANHLPESSPPYVEYQPDVYESSARVMHEIENSGRYYQREGPHLSEFGHQSNIQSKPLTVYSPGEYDPIRRSSLTNEAQQLLWVRKPSYEGTRDFQTIRKFPMHDQHHRTRDVNKRTWLQMISQGQEGMQVQRMQKVVFTPQMNDPLNVERERKLVYKRGKKNEMATMAGRKHENFQRYQQRVPKFGDMKTFRRYQVRPERSTEVEIEKPTHLENSAHVLTRPSEKKGKGNIGKVEREWKPPCIKNEQASPSRDLENDTGCTEKAKKEGGADGPTAAIPFRSFNQLLAPPAAKKTPGGKVRKIFSPASAPTSSTSPSILTRNPVQMPKSSNSNAPGAMFGRYKDFPTPNHKLLPPQINLYDETLWGSACMICHKKFSTTTSRKRHMRIHTDEKPFQCPVCYKSFRQKTHQKKHVESVHSRSKPSISLPEDFGVQNQ
mmetsp:Transcript_20524/g.28677  ORF Transcript_20524/g.28677 Transcript_20524/m.28677 type:complete len:486 (+) Transcript_20524:220-1677(+)